MDEFTRVPGVFRRWELEQLLVPGSDFHIEAAADLLPGTPLFTLYRQPLDDLLPRRRLTPKPPTIEPGTGGAPERAGAPLSVELPTDLQEPSLGELRSQHREQHLCLKCDHHMVCSMAKALDSNLLVTISHCLAFLSRADDPQVVELQPIESLGHF